MADRQEQVIHTTKYEESDYTFDPEQVKKFFTSNFIQRVWAHLFGLTASGKRKALEVTEAGVLKTATTGAGLDTYYRNPTSDNDDWNTVVGNTPEEETFPAIMSGFSIKMKDFDGFIEIDSDGSGYKQKILISGSDKEEKNWDFPILKMRISNYDDGGSADCSYYLVGYK